MKSFFVAVAVLISFMVSATNLHAHKRTVDGVSIFVELQTGANGPVKRLSFGTIIDLGEMAGQPNQPKGKNSAPRKICEDEIAEIKYYFWIESGHDHESNYFYLSVNQTKEGLGLSGISGNISVEGAQKYNGLQIFYASSGNPTFHVRVYVFTDIKQFFRDYDFSSHIPLNCRYPLYSYPKASE